MTNKIPTNENTNRDGFQFTLAMIIICSFTMFEGIVILNDSVKFDDSFQILSMTAPFVGTIIGFYFGQKPTQNLTKQVVQATSDKEAMKTSLVDTIRNSESLEKRLVMMEKKMENLNRTFGDN